MHFPTIIKETSSPDARRLALKAMVVQSEIDAHHLSKSTTSFYRNNRWIWNRDLARLNGKLDFYIACLKSSHGETI